MFFTLPIFSSGILLTSCFVLFLKSLFPVTSPTPPLPKLKAPKRFSVVLSSVRARPTARPPPKNGRRRQVGQCVFTPPPEFAHQHAHYGHEWTDFNCFFIQSSRCQASDSTLCACDDVPNLAWREKNAVGLRRGAHAGHMWFQQAVSHVNLPQHSLALKERFDISEGCSL